MKTDSIVLASTRVINGVVPLRGIVTIQLLCTNLSGNTTFSVYSSLDKTNWDVVQVLDVDWQGTLVDDAAFVQSFNLGPGVYFKVQFDGSTTGTVAYIHNGL